MPTFHPAFAYRVASSRPIPEEAPTMITVRECVGVAATVYMINELAWRNHDLLHPVNREFYTSRYTSNANLNIVPHTAIKKTILMNAFPFSMAVLAPNTPPMPLHTAIGMAMP